jgi:hypothetical protein
LMYSRTAVITLISLLLCWFAITNAMLLGLRSLLAGGTGFQVFERFESLLLRSSCFLL